MAAKLRKMVSLSLRRLGASRKRKPNVKSCRGERGQEVMGRGWKAGERDKKWEVLVDLG